MIAGYVWGDEPAGAATKWWAYVVAGYAGMAAAFGLLLCDSLADFFDVRLAVLGAIFFAGPIALAATWLSGSAYDILGIMFWALFGIWALQLAGSLAWELWRRLR